MKFSRRGFFGAAAASPMAIEAVAKEVSGMALASAPPDAGGWALPTQAPKAFSVSEMLSMHKADMARLVRPKPRPRSVCRLDPDLIANRSMALHSKLSIQAERNADREYETEAGWIRSRIDDLLKS